MTNNNSASGGKKSFQNAKWIGLKFEEGIFSFQEQKIWSPMQNPIHSEFNYVDLGLNLYKFLNWSNKLFSLALVAQD